MSDALDAIHSEVGAENFVDLCSRDDCDVDLTDVPDARVIIDMDKALPAHERKGRRCDFILFVDRGQRPLFSVPIELKSGRIRMATAIEQLQGGADFAARFVSPSDADCVPVLIHRKHLYSAERTKLNQEKIIFHDRERTIRTARCGHSRNLAGVLPK